MKRGCIKIGALVLALVWALRAVVFAGDTNTFKEGFKEVHKGMKKVTRTVDKNAKEGVRTVDKNAKKGLRTVDKNARKTWKKAGRDIKKAVDD